MVCFRNFLSTFASKYEVLSYKNKKKWFLYFVLLSFHCDCRNLFFHRKQTYFTLLLWLKWNLINLWHDEFTVMYSKYQRKNYSGSSIGRAPNLLAGVVVLITSMCKWLLSCLQMAISTGPTQVCHGLALDDVAVFLKNSRTNFNRVWTTLSPMWCIETNLRQKCEPG